MYYHFIVICSKIFENLEKDIFPANTKNLNLFLTLNLHTCIFSIFLNRAKTLLPLIFARLFVSEILLFDFVEVVTN